MISVNFVLLRLPIWANLTIYQVDYPEKHFHSVTTAEDWKSSQSSNFIFREGVFIRFYLN